jgi:DNA topoisomerase-1
MRAFIIIEANGKVATWTKIVRAIGMDADVFATQGHLCRFPKGLYPVGLTLTTADKPIDPVRRPVLEVVASLKEKVDSLPHQTPIYIATDNDVEGDTIALDIGEAILEHAPGRIGHLHRLRPGSITPDAVRQAIKEADLAPADFAGLRDRAVQGRARAVTDRWIGAAFSRDAGLPVGRVRSAILGSAFIWQHAPNAGRQRPDTGEIMLQSRSIKGGRPFQARVPFSTTSDPRIARLIALGQKFENGMVPGAVQPRQSLSAAVAPRYGSVQPFSTGEALVHAARHHNIAPNEGMRGLQRAYLGGLVSYPRTDSNVVSLETASRIVRIGTACEIGGLSVAAMTDHDATGTPLAHDALHPVMGTSPEEMKLLRDIVFDGDTETSHLDPVTVLMARLVTRRALEASRPIELEVGDWRAGNNIRPEALSDEDMTLLSNLKWERETLPPLPWGRDLSTGVRLWPLASVIMEGMMIEEIGKASTMAIHVETALSSGDLDMPEPGALPRLTPQGLNAVRKTRRALWNPATCRKIEEHLSGEWDTDCGDRLSFDERVRHRVVGWLLELPDDLQTILLDALDDQSGLPVAAGATVSAAAAEPEADSPFDIGLLAPAPDWA